MAIIVSTAIKTSFSIYNRACSKSRKTRAKTETTPRGPERNTRTPSSPTHRPAISSRSSRRPTRPSRLLADTDPIKAELTLVFSGKRRCVRGGRSVDSFVRDSGFLFYLNFWRCVCHVPSKGTAYTGEKQ